MFLHACHGFRLAKAWHLCQQRRQSVFAPSCTQLCEDALINDDQQKVHNILI